MSGVTDQPVVHLREAGTSVVVSISGGRLPRILYWGADLGELSDTALSAIETAQSPTIGDSVVTYPQPVPLVPQLAENWLGRPGISGSRDGRAWAPKFTDAVSEIRRAETGTSLHTWAIDRESQLVIRTEIELFSSGVVRARAEVQNDGDPYRLDSLEVALPVPDVASELMDFTGRWSLERVPQRHPFSVGHWTRESRGGKPGLDNSTLLIAGVPDFGFRRGRVWAVHLGWSGNQVIGAERTPAGTRILRAGELLLADEVVLQPDERYSTPWVYGSWGDGLDELAARFHAFVRSRPSHPASPRPVLVNTWEAVYFDHDPERIVQLAERSAQIGVERFVVDDGWFIGRADDTTSLGDWAVDPGSWPEGLRPLADRVHELGMEFGLWLEPEMISVESELARAHPDWLFDGGHGRGDPSRHQYVLDLGHPEAYAYILDSVSTLVDAIGIDFIKWDHNRSLTDAGHQPEGRPGVHVQTTQLYRMLDELRQRHPGLEIESCASGGGRIDLGILERTDRVWPSDCNDPHERLEIQKWTGLLLPPELLGNHIGAEESHTTHRHSVLDFRAATALWGNLGVELDVTRLNEAELESVRRWVSFHKQVRHLLHSGTGIHADFAEAGLRLEGVVAPDRESALFQFSLTERPIQWPPEKLRLEGLDPLRNYLVTEAVVNDAVPAGQRPPWMREGITLPGSVLAAVGIEAPSLDVDRCVLFSVRAVR